MQPRRGREDEAYTASALEGDAVTPPAVEEQLEAVVRGDVPGTDSATIKNLVGVLESQGGPALGAASRNGRWAVPWVGGWQRLCTSDDDQSFIGGPGGKRLRGAVGAKAQSVSGEMPANKQRNAEDATAVTGSKPEEEDETGSE